MAMYQESGVTDSETLKKESVLNPSGKSIDSSRISSNTLDRII